MAVFHFTLHAYRSWNTDDARGWVQRGTPGVQEPNVRLARARNLAAKWPAVTFNAEDAKYMVDQMADVVARRGWELFGVTAIPTHVHAVVGWREAWHQDDVQTRLKRGLGFLLAKRHGTGGRPYFSRGGIPERVKDRAHLIHLLTVYLPEHHGPI